MMAFVPFVAFVGRRRPDPDPAEALRRLAGGDLAALDGLYRQEAAPVYRYALALCGREDWAADATQDAFVSLASRPQGFDPARGALGAYLAGIARHALAARWRAEQGWFPLDEAVAGGDADDEDDRGIAGLDRAPSPESALSLAQDSAAVWRALRSLPPAFREAIVLVDLQDRPYAEAAQIAGIELNTLRSRLHRARARLAALLSGDDRRTP